MYNIEEMKRELVEIGDFSYAEVQEMKVHEIIVAWTSLPAFVI